MHTKRNHYRLELYKSINYAFLAGLLQINQAAKYNVTGPVIVQRNCTNIVYRTDVQYFQKPQYYEWLNFIVYTNETDFVRLILYFCTVFKNNTYA